MLTELDGTRRFDAAFDATLLGPECSATVAGQGLYVGVFPGLEPPSEREVTIRSGVVVPDGRLLRGRLSLTADGVLKARPADTLPLERAVHAYEALRAGRRRGRWLLTP